MDDTKTYKFRINNVTHEIQAETHLKAMVEANRRFIWGKVDNFYGWVGSEESRYYTASYGYWD